MLVRTILAVSPFTLYHAVSIWYDHVLWMHGSKSGFDLNLSVNDNTTFVKHVTTRAWCEIPSSRNAKFWKSFKRCWAFLWQSQYDRHLRLDSRCFGEFCAPRRSADSQQVHRMKKSWDFWWQHSYWPSAWRTRISTKTEGALSRSNINSFLIENTVSWVVISRGLDRYTTSLSEKDPNSTSTSTNSHTRAPSNWWRRLSWVFQDSEAPPLYLVGRAYYLAIDPLSQEETLCDNKFRQVSPLRAVPSKW